MTTVMQESQDSQRATVDTAMNILFNKLDVAIDDMKNGRVQTIDEAWEEIDTI